MKKMKKTLAVLLAIFMLASFAPLYASAATVTLNANNVIILEAPKITYGEQKEVNKITVDYGVAPKDLTVTGGKLGYVASEGATPVEVPGTFSGSSSIKLSVGDDIAIRIKFTPTDTTTYSALTVSDSYTMADGVVWPTAKVVGQAVTLVEMPTPLETSIGLGSRLGTAAKLSGGVVHDASGNVVSGTWSYVNNRYMDTEGTFEEEIQWKKSGYETLKAKVTITVKMYKTTLAEAPVMSELSITDRSTPAWTASTPSGGKVLDDEGNEVTGGKWTVTEYPQGTYAYADGVASLKWTKVGYETIETTATIKVNQNHTYYNFEKGASLVLSGQDLVYSPDRTYENLEINPAIIKDKDGNVVEGKYSIRISSSSTTDLTGPVGVHTVTVTSPNLKYIFFTPNDTSLPAVCFIDKLGNIAKADFALSDDSVLVLNYGAAHETTYYGDDLQFSTLKTVPEEAGVYSIGWTKDKFDPATADYGSVTYVDVAVSSSNKNYNNVTVRLAIKIQPYTQTSYFYGSNGEAVSYMMHDDQDDGLISYKVSFTNPRLLGSVVVTATDGTNNYDIATVECDENGVYDTTGTWQAPGDGDYVFTFTYVASDKDTAVFSNENYKSITREAVSVDMKEYRTLTIKIADKVITETVREGTAYYKAWSEMTDIDSGVFYSWEAVDADGNPVDIHYNNAAQEDGSKDANLKFVMPECDVTFTAKSESGEAVEEGMFGGSLWSFWQKLINFITEIYRTIVDFFVPSVEKY